MADTELAARTFAAMNALEQKLGRRVKLKDLGRRVADLLGEEDPVAESVVGRWLKGEQTPRTRATWWAFAGALEVDPGWLTYGTGTMEPKVAAVAENPPGYVSTATTPALPMKTAASKPATAKKRKGGR